MVWSKHTPDPECETPNPQSEKGRRARTPPGMSIERITSFGEAVRLQACLAPKGGNVHLPKAKSEAFPEDLLRSLTVNNYIRCLPVAGAPPFVSPPRAKS